MYVGRSPWRAVQRPPKTLSADLSNFPDRWETMCFASQNARRLRVVPWARGSQSDQNSSPLSHGAKPLRTERASNPVFEISLALARGSITAVSWNLSLVTALLAYEAPSFAWADPKVPRPHLLCKWLSPELGSVRG